MTDGVQPTLVRSGPANGVSTITLDSPHNANALSTDLLREEIAATRPLSVLRPQEIGTLRAWGRDHAVGA